MYEITGKKFVTQLLQNYQDLLKQNNYKIIMAWSVAPVPELKKESKVEQFNQ